VQIDNIKINGFGKIKNKEIDFKDGINIVYGTNEAGKSTILKFIMSMFYGACKNKNGKNISDFDKYKPWDGTEFSGKIKYKLDNAEEYEVFREFKKKTPVIYNNLGEDITKNFSIDKSKEINFIEQQIGIDEKMFSKSSLIEQQEIKLEKNDTNHIIQKISNLVSTGDDSISFKKAMEKITKMQNERIGTDRTKNKPLNIVENNFKKLLEEKKYIESYIADKKAGLSEKDKIQNKLSELKRKKSQLKEEKISSEEEKIETAKNSKNIYMYLLIFFIAMCIILAVVVKNVIVSVATVIPIIVCGILMKKKSSSQLEYLKKTNQDLAKKFEEKDEKIQAEMNNLNLKLHMIQTQNSEYEKYLEQLTKIQEKLEEQNAIREELNSLDVSFNLAKECLENAYEEIKHNISPKFQDKLCEISSEITAGKYKNILVNDEQGLFIEVENGEYKPVDRLSVGTIDEMYLALRLSVLEEVSKEKLPIIFDETFAYFDNERLKNIICYLQDQNYDNQIIIFTCSDREKNALNELKIEYNLINLEK